MGSISAQILDAAADEAYLGTSARIAVKLGQARTIAGVALRKDGALLGAIRIYRQEVRSPRPLRGPWAALPSTIGPHKPDEGRSRLGALLEGCGGT